MPPAPLRWISGRVVVVGLLLAVVIVVGAVHWPVLSAGAVFFDDMEYLFYNPVLRKPSWSSARTVLTEVFESSTIEGYYEPLTLISLMLDVAAGGRRDDLRAFHRTSLAVHVLNTALVVLLLYQLFGEPWSAALAGLLFGVHPLTVEPVAWVWERKTLLTTFFILCSLVLYVRYARRGGAILYSACLVSYVLALLSKPTSTPLPVLMLLMDFWPLRRLGKRSVLEKLPFFLVAAASSAITVISTSRNCGIKLPAGPFVGQMPVKISYLLVFYLGKIVWPVGLSPVYSIPAMSLSDRTVLAAVLGACFLTVGLLISLPRTRAMLTAWLFFVVAISPTLGLIGYSWISASDKYVYLPAIGLVVLLAYGLTRLVRAGFESRRMTPICVAVVASVILLAVSASGATRRQIARWRETEGLYRYMLTLAPDSAAIHDDLGIALARKMKLDEAIACFRRGLQLHPDSDRLHNNLGKTLSSARRWSEAADEYRRALQLDPGNYKAHMNLADALIEQRRPAEAIGHYVEALRLKPTWVPAMNDLAWLLATHPDAGVREPAEAVKRAERACALTNYRNPMMLDTLAAAYAAAGRFSDAVRTAQTALKLIGSSGRNPLADKLQARLKLYTAGQPYVEPASSQPTGGPSTLMQLPGPEKTAADLH